MGSFLPPSPEACTLEGLPASWMVCGGTQRSSEVLKGPGVLAEDTAELLAPPPGEKR